MRGLLFLGAERELREPGRSGSSANQGGAGDARAGAGAGSSPVTASWSPYGD
jgi:hypothetical protein